MFFFFIATSGKAEADNCEKGLLTAFVLILHVLFYMSRYRDALVY